MGGGCRYYSAVRGRQTSSSFSGVEVEDQSLPPNPATPLKAILIPFIITQSFPGNFWQSLVNNAGNFCGMVLLDLQKALDTVDHPILLYKLMALGFNSMAVDWLRSYLSGRYQRVDVNSTFVYCQVNQLWSSTRECFRAPLPVIYQLYEIILFLSAFLYANNLAILVSHKDKSMVATRETAFAELEGISN